MQGAGVSGRKTEKRSPKRAVSVCTVFHHLFFSFFLKIDSNLAAVPMQKSGCHPLGYGGTSVTGGWWAVGEACSLEPPFPPREWHKGKAALLPVVPAGQARARRAGSGALGGMHRSQPSRARPTGGPKSGSISQPKPPLRSAASSPLPPA